MIEYRPAAPAEFPVAAQLRHEMGIEMGTDLDAAGANWRRRFAAFFAGKQGVNRGRLFLAFDGEQAVGMTAITLTEEWRTFCFGTRFGWVNAVFVKPGYRRRGIARELLRRAVDWARERGCVRVRLRTSSEGRALYEQAGFHAGREMELDL